MLVVGSFAVDYHLWDSLGDRHLPTVGPLFVVPAVLGVVLAVAEDLPGSRCWWRRSLVSP